METLSPKKKVLFVITKSNWGGAQRYVYDLATHLPQEQFATAVALGGTGELTQRLQRENIPVIQLQSVQRDISVSADISGFSSMYRAIRAYQPDIVHLNSSKAGGLGVVAARLYAVPQIIFTAHGWPFAEKRNVLWRLFAFLGSWVTALLSHRVIVVSKNDLELGRKMPLCGEKMHLIHNGIELPLKLDNGNIIRSAFPPNARITGTIGEMNRNKNQITLIEESRTNPEMYVAIVGEGDLHQWLQEKVNKYGLQDRVKLFGFVPVEKVLRGFDIFALPSTKEGLPYVLLEAKAAGLPIRASRVGGIPDILDTEDIHEFSLEHMVAKTAALYRS